MEKTMSHAPGSTTCTEDCCCGHDHSHHHDHACLDDCCGHDHSHHHDHGGHDDCCGHDHGCCGCGHDHGAETQCRSAAMLSNTPLKISQLAKFLR